MNEIRQNGHCVLSSRCDWSVQENPFNSYTINRFDKVLRHIALSLFCYETLMFFNVQEESCTYSYNNLPLYCIIIKVLVTRVNVTRLSTFR